jgi:hypothetical protein
MVRYRKIKMYGNTWVIPLNSIDVKDFNLKLGDEVDIEDMLERRILTEKKK